MPGIKSIPKIIGQLPTQAGLPLGPLMVSGLEGVWGSICPMEKPDHRRKSIRK